MKAGSNLERVLRAGHFAFTAELGPPRGADVEALRRKAAFLRGRVDAVNVTDNQTAVVRMSSWGASLIALQEGLEPVYQMVCRDRNRLAMQADVLGASANGIRNLLCLSGDLQEFGDHPEAKSVYDIDSLQLLQAVRGMRDDGKFLSGRPVETPPRIFLGAAANPFADLPQFRARRLAKKVRAGADFVQTQCVFNMKRFAEFVDQAGELGVLDRVFLLAGITPLKSVAMATYMQQKVPGMDVPEALLRRLGGVPKKQVADEGIRIACEQIAELRAMKGVSGVHLMAIEWEHRVPEIAERAGLLPRPVS
ncbi:MAG: methylenetetrahydrofolate reductase [Deltaproteobacteria bacterium]|nr:methylenetetrahydrofolate reductase [Deltaproteobacteria bacterium]